MTKMPMTLSIKFTQRRIEVESCTYLCCAYGFSASHLQFSERYTKSMDSEKLTKECLPVTAAADG